MDYHGHKQGERQRHLGVYWENLQLVQASLSSSALIHRARPETLRDQSCLYVVCAALSTASSRPTEANLTQANHSHSPHKKGTLGAAGHFLDEHPALCFAPF